MRVKETIFLPDVMIPCKTGGVSQYQGALRLIEGLLTFLPKGCTPC